MCFFIHALHVKHLHRRPAAGSSPRELSLPPPPMLPACQSSVIAILEEQYGAARLQPHRFIATPNLLMSSAEAIFSASAAADITATAAAKEEVGGENEEGGGVRRPGKASSDSRGQPEPLGGGTKQKRFW